MKYITYIFFILTPIALLAQTDAPPTDSLSGVIYELRKTELAFSLQDGLAKLRAVSYTHLTLPTKA